MSLMMPRRGPSPRSTRRHVRLAAATGFVTGLGGIATLPVTVPAALAGLYVIAARMTAGIAHLRGYDVETDEVRSAILVSLLGSAGASVLATSGSRSASGRRPRRWTGSPAASSPS